MTKPFDYVNSIIKSKNNMMRDTANDDLAEKDYPSYLVNKALSYYPDTLLHANLVNTNHHLDNRPQYEFLLNSIRPKKRFVEWVKPNDSEDLNIVCAFYKCNHERGREYLSLLSSDQLDMIKKQLETGGIKNESNRNAGRNRTTK